MGLGSCASQELTVVKSKKFEYAEKCHELSQYFKTQEGLPQADGLADTLEFTAIHCAFELVESVVKRYPTEVHAIKLRYDSEEEVDILTFPNGRLVARGVDLEACVGAIDKTYYRANPPDTLPLVDVIMSGLRDLHNQGKVEFD